jgi:hypothetical protein
MHLTVREQRHEVKRCSATIPGASAERRTAFFHPDGIQQVVFQSQYYVRAYAGIPEVILSQIG